MRQRLVTKGRSADKAKFSADKAKFSADRAKFSADKVKYSVDKTKFSMDKTKFSFDKAKVAEDMTKFSMDKTKFSMAKTKFSMDKTKFAEDMTKFSMDKTKFSMDKTKFAEDMTKFSMDKTKFSMDKTKFSFDKAKFAEDLTKFTKFSADKAKLSCGRGRPKNSAELLRIFRRTLVSTLPANPNFQEGLCSSMPNIKILSEAPKKRPLFGVRFQLFQSQFAEERRSASMPTLSFRRAIKMKTCGCVCRMFCRRRELHKARSEELKKKANGAV